MCRKFIMQSLRVTERNVVDPNDPFMHAAGAATQVTVRRDAMFADGFGAMDGLPAHKLKGRLRLQFIDAYGEPEAGIDGGGLFKDFMEHLLQARAPVTCSAKHSDGRKFAHVCAA
jgi:hypothetical protein